MPVNSGPFATLPLFLISSRSFYIRFKSSRCLLVFFLFSSSCLNHEPQSGACVRPHQLPSAERLYYIHTYLPKAVSETRFLEVCLIRRLARCPVCPLEMLLSGSDFFFRRIPSTTLCLHPSNSRFVTTPVKRPRGVFSSYLIVLRLAFVTKRFFTIKLFRVKTCRLIPD